MILNVHKRGNAIVVAACDEALLDTTVRGGELKIHVSKKFYGEEVCREEDLVMALRSCTTANLVGEEVVGIAIKAGFVDEACVIYIGKVPHAQLYKLSLGSC